MRRPVLPLCHACLPACLPASPTCAHPHPPSPQGTEDDLIGGFEQAYFDALPAGVKAKSVLSVFDPESGGALHCQIGAHGAAGLPRVAVAAALGEGRHALEE